VYRIPKFGGNAVSSSSSVLDVLGRLDSWIWEHNVFPKRRNVVTKWHGVISQKNVILICTAVETSKLAKFVNLVYMKFKLNKISKLWSATFLVNRAPLRRYWIVPVPQSVLKHDINILKHRIAFTLFMLVLQWTVHLLLEVRLIYLCVFPVKFIWGWCLLKC
jgi:hypothetical protein